MISGELTPQCAAVLATVLEALSAPRDAQDTRSHEQRYHDALEEALRRLVAAGLRPERAGQPAKVWAHISLAAVAAPVPLSALSRDALEQQIIGAAVDLLSGPGGLASFLRRRQLGARLAGPSLPLDIGLSWDIPALIRHAVKLRDQRRRWAGGYFL